jgi:SAM-dependent methyltransferase
MPVSAQEYETKDPTYFGCVRTEILPLLPSRMERVLEIGCGSGATLSYLKATGQAGWTAGVELFPEAAAEARQRLDYLVEGNIETMDLDLEPGSIDAILCLDVLEHLFDPWAVVRKLDRLLRPGGVLIASIPNVRHVQVLVPLLLRGRWDYVDAGLLDRTHVRFFVRSTAIDLMECSGLEVDAIDSTGPLTRRPVLALLNRLTFSVFRGFLDYQYLIRARKVAG